MWPQIDNNIIDRVSEVLKSGKLNQWNNNLVKDFENKFSEKMDCKYGVAVFNGTVALELCLKSLELNEGDEVIVTSRTFIASAMSCVINRLRPVFVDVDLESQNISLDTIKEKINNKTKAIILVHLAGWPCDLEEICKFAKDNNIFVIEDCAQAHGSKYNNKSVGSYGDISAWSFCQDKIMTTGGEGGMVTTNNSLLFKKAWSIKDHGKNYDLVHDKTHEFGFRWLHTDIGTNYRMMPIQAVIGLEQLLLLDNWINHRRSIANIYNESLKNIDGVRITIPGDNIYHSYYKYYFFIDPKKFKLSRNDIIQTICNNNIPSFVGSCGEVYLEESMIDYKPNERLSNCIKLFETSIMLLCDPTISLDEATNNIFTIIGILSENLIN
jgi:dTDP-4-amino-4,6-dideoxygalactose transaminase